MRVTSITEFVTDTGTYIEWPVSLGEGVPSSVPPSFNQGFHLTAALAEGGSATPAVWIASAFDVPGSVDVDALAWAFGHFIERHPALRTTFHPSSGTVVRKVHAAEHVVLGAPLRTEIDDALELRDHVRRRLDARCHPSQSPSYSFAAVDRQDRSTILCGFDHSHVDAVSITVAAEEISALYESRLNGGEPALPTPGSFVDYCATEAQTTVVPMSDPRVHAWSDFVESCGGSTPEFPFDLGVAPGEQAPQATTIHHLAGADEAASFEFECRELGAGMFSGVAAAMAEATTRIGGPTELPLLFPLHTRQEEQYAHAVGWFTTNAPMRVSVGDNFAATLASAHTAFRAALPLGTVPIPRVIEALGENFRLARHDVFMISYIDYRRLPGAAAIDRNAHHISNVTTADDAQFWITRTADGLSLRSRFPDTETAHSVIEQFVEQLRCVVIAGAGTAPAQHELSLVAPSA